MPLNSSILTWRSGARKGSAPRARRAGGGREARQDAPARLPSRRLSVPTTSEALRKGARAAGRSAWLVAPGLLVALLRTALGWPALLFALGIARAGMAERFPAGLTQPGSLLSGAVEAITAPRAVSILAGLWLAGQLASAALRVVWLSGAADPGRGAGAATRVTGALRRGRRLRLRPPPLHGVARLPLRARGPGLRARHGFGRRGRRLSATLGEPIRCLPRCSERARSLPPWRSR